MGVRCQRPAKRVLATGGWGRDWIESQPMSGFLMGYHDRGFFEIDIGFGVRNRNSEIEEDRNSKRTDPGHDPNTPAGDA